MTYRLRAAEIISLHSDICAAPLIDGFKLNAALESPFAGHVGGEFYPSLIQKAGKLCEAMARAHPFLDGNKRMAWLACTMFLRLNGVIVEADQDEAADVVIQITAGTMSLEMLTLWLNDRAI